MPQRQCTTTRLLHASTAVCCFVLLAIPNLTVAGQLQRASKAARSVLHAKPTKKADDKERTERKKSEKKKSGKSFLSSAGKLVRASAQVHHEPPVPTPIDQRGQSPRRGYHRSNHSSSGLVISAGPAWYPPVYTEQQVVVYETLPAPPPVYDEQMVINPPAWDGPVVDPCPPMAVPEEIGWDVRFVTDLASNFDELSRFSMGFRANQYRGWGIDTNAGLYWESLPQGERAHMWIGDFNVVYEVFRSDLVSARAGVGLNFLSDTWGGAAGLNFTVGLDAQLTERWNVSGEFDAGTLGSASHFHGRVTTGVWVNNSQWFVGYDFRDLGGVQLDQLVSGVAFRF
ncbi:MAG: hypothetical protein KDA60_20465 [Planctomycetales bacterium]|nr:hypothetical protein [Planctomycetales bacterium]